MLVSGAVCAQSLGDPVQSGDYRLGGSAAVSSEAIDAINSWRNRAASLTTANAEPHELRDTLLEGIAIQHPTRDLSREFLSSLADADLVALHQEIRSPEAPKPGDLASRGQVAREVLSRPSLQSVHSEYRYDLARVQLLQSEDSESALNVLSGAVAEAVENEYDARLRALQELMTRPESELAYDEAIRTLTISEDYGVRLPRWWVSRRVLGQFSKSAPELYAPAAWNGSAKPLIAVLRSAFEYGNFEVYASISPIINQEVFANIDDAAQLYYYSGMMYYAEDLHREALPHFIKSFGTDSTEIHAASALLRIGQSQTALGEYVAAASAFSNTLELFPHHLEVQRAAADELEELVRSGLITEEELATASEQDPRELAAATLESTDQYREGGEE